MFAMRLKGSSILNIDLSSGMVSDGLIAITVAGIACVVVNGVGLTLG